MFKKQTVKDTTRSKPYCVTVKYFLDFISYNIAKLELKYAFGILIF